MADTAAIFEEALDADRVRAGEDVSPDYGHDETLSLDPVMPSAVVFPESTDDVVAIVAAAREHGIALTARGSGSGLAGAATAADGDGVVVSFERMNAILEVDHDNHVAVVQPGVTLAELDAHLAPLGYVYPVRPGADSASLGGTVNTNAAGMRAVKHGVTRNHVIGLEVVLASGEVIRTGGKIVKLSSGYDLTQVLVGSEGTLGLVTEITLKLLPRLPVGATILAPFSDLAGVTSAIPRILETGLRPLILEYIDLLTMMAIVQRNNLELGVPEAIRQQALAYLVIQVEDARTERVDEDAMQLAALLAEDLGALDVYVLPKDAASALITAREHAFWAAQEMGFHDVIDVVVPRASLPEYMALVAAIGQEHSTGIVGCGHAGDGNVHMSVLQPDDELRHTIMRKLLKGGIDLGGAISGEHGIGREKKSYLAEFGDPVQLELMRGIKRAFDPDGILNPGVIFD